MSEELKRRMTTEEQLSAFGCDLIDLLRREGRHSGVWFADSLLRAADEIERLHTERTPAPLPTASLNVSEEVVEALRFYADEARWRPSSSGVTPAMDDKGFRAREALSSLPTEGEK